MKIDIKNIKDKILQLAISGKLVEQDPSDEPADILYEKIQDEKERLIEEKKIRRANVKDIEDDEIPFEIPDSWKWVRLGEITNIKMGQSPKGNTVSSEYVENAIEFHQGKTYYGDR